MPSKLHLLKAVSRDPWGILAFGTSGSEIGFYLSPRVCTYDLETRELRGCLPAEGSTGEPLASRFPVMIDVSPEATPQPGKGTEISMGAACAGARASFLPRARRDYTQTDSLQVFEIEVGDGRRDQRRIGISRADHGAAYRAADAPAPLCEILRLEIMKRIACPFRARNSLRPALRAHRVLVRLRTAAESHGVDAPANRRHLARPDERTHCRH